MKSLFLSLLLVGTAQFAHAASVELGKYAAVDADTKTIQANFELKAGGALTFTVKSADGSMPPTNCTGNYSVAGNTLSANLTCQSNLLPKASVQIDISTVTPQALRSANGAEVNVAIDALGGEPTKFLLKKAD